MIDIDRRLVYYKTVTDAYTDVFQIQSGNHEVNMERPVIKDPIFLARPSETATADDLAAAQDLLGAISQYVKVSGYADSVDLDAAFTSCADANCVTVDCEEIAPAIDSVKQAIDNGVKAL